MKCLENLSMVKDECLDDLQKDIESLINSYINVEKTCLELFEEVKDNLRKQDIIKICKVYGDWFIEEPISVYCKADFGKVGEILLVRADHDAYNLADDILNMFGNRCNVGIIDFDKKKYWFYIDEANWEPWIVDEEYFKKEISEAITFQSEDRLLEILRILKRIKKREKL